MNKQNKTGHGRMSNAQAISTLASSVAALAAQVERMDAKLRANEPKPVAETVKPQVVKPGRKGGRKAQASANEKSGKPIGFTAYMGQHANVKLGDLTGKERRHVEYVLAGYGLAFDPTMTKAEYAKACATAKANGVKWTFKRPTTQAQVPARKAGRKAQVQAQAPAKDESSMIAKITAAVVSALKQA